MHSGLNADIAKRIFTQVILPKAMYAGSLWNNKDQVPMHCYLQSILGTHYNPPTEVLHILSGVLPMALMLTKERLQIARALASYLSTRNHTVQVTWSGKRKISARAIAIWRVSNFAFCAHHHCIEILVHHLLPLVAYNIVFRALLH